MTSQGMVAVPVWTGRESGQLRAALRMSQREYAAFLGASPRTVAGWEAKGEAAVISSDFQSVLDTALERAGHAIQRRFAAFLAGDLATPAAGKRSRANAAGAGSPLPMQGDYRDLIRSAYALPQPGRVPLSETDVGVVRGMLESLTAADHQFGGGFARRTADSFVLEVIRPRLDAPGSGSVARDFRAVAAEMQVRVAWMHLDVADHAAARDAVRDAFKLAQQSEDLTVCSWVMAMSALLETWLGNTAAARAMGQAAVGLAAGGPRLVRAFAQGKLARALAAAGDSSGTLAALSQARSLFESARPHEDERIPAAIREGGYGAAYILDEEAHCFRDLGRDNRALTLSEQCLDMRGTDHFPRNRAFATGNLALAVARVGDVDQACDTTMSLLHLAVALQSSRVARRLDAVLDELMPFRGTRPVAELIEQVNETGVTRLRR